MRRSLVVWLLAALILSGCILRKNAADSTPKALRLAAEFTTMVPPSPTSGGRSLDLSPTCAGPNDPLRDCAAQDPIWTASGNASTTFATTSKWFFAKVRDCNHHTLHFGVEVTGASPRLHLSFARVADPLRAIAQDARIVEARLTSTEMACTQGV